MQNRQVSWSWCSQQQTNRGIWMMQCDGDLKSASTSHCPTYQLENPCLLSFWRALTLLVMCLLLNWHIWLRACLVLIFIVSAEMHQWCPCDEQLLTSPQNKLCKWERKACWHSRMHVFLHLHLGSLTRNDFLEALKKMTPSVSQAELHAYDKWTKEFASY